METYILGIWISIFLSCIFWRDFKFCPQGVWGNAGECVLFLKSAKMKKLENQNKDMAKDYSKLEKEDLLKVIEKIESHKKYGLIWDDLKF